MAYMGSSHSPFRPSSSWLRTNTPGRRNSTSGLLHTLPRFLLLSHWTLDVPWPLWQRGDQTGAVVNSN